MGTKFNLHRFFLPGIAVVVLLQLYACSSARSNLPPQTNAPCGKTFVKYDHHNKNRSPDLLMRDLNADQFQGQWKQFRITNGQVSCAAKLDGPTDLDLEFVAMLDINGDGANDILLRSQSSHIWYAALIVDGNTLASKPVALPDMPTDVNIQFQAAGDFNGDGTDDILVRNVSEGNWLVYYFKDGAVKRLGPATLYQNLDYVFQAVGDFDGDGKTDVLFRASNSMCTSKEPISCAWYVYSFASHAVYPFSSLYSIPTVEFAAVLDLNGDGKQDVILRDRDTGYWKAFIMHRDILFAIMNGDDPYSAISVTLKNLYLNPGVTIAAAADFNSDNLGDVLLREPSGRLDTFLTLPKGFELLPHKTSTAYTVNQIVTENNGAFLCTTSGTTSAEPVVLHAGSTIDGTAVFVYIGNANLYTEGQQVMIGHPALMTPSPNWSLMR